MSKINLSQTQIQLPDSIEWPGSERFPEKSLKDTVLAGSLDRSFHLSIE